MSSEAAVREAFHEHRRYIWGLCYRMTGSGADADDLVQDTWLRALERPPTDLGAPLRPWLSTVAANLSRDALRRRRTRSYQGSWIPAPALEEQLEAPESERPDARYGRAESATLAFLVALEALTPSQRAVLLLRDVYESTTSETAAATGLSEPNVKTTLHRARKALGDYDANPCRPTPELQERVQAALVGFALAVATCDPAKIADVFTEDAELWSDANGEFLSNLRPLQGAAAISRFYAARTAKLGPPPWSSIATLNHLPTALLQFGDLKNPRLAQRVAFSVVLAPNGKIKTLLNIVNTKKLSSLHPIYPTP